MNEINRISGAAWSRYLQWAEDYFLFPTSSKKPLASVVAFRFAGLNKTLVVRNKSNAVYTGASIRALLIRITDSGELNQAENFLTELDFGTCVLELFDGDDISACFHALSPVCYFFHLSSLCPLSKLTQTDRVLGSSWPEWKVEAKEIGCSSKWYSEVLGWSDGQIKEEFGLGSRSGPSINVATPV
ncbi:hypothetical protein PFICI_04515 [Pestalotiopsis fici W106-1]|uniref:Uncharacterized protein n=1 Tax=Pestalotiopsis fici (strain W106-1 / CGMCC3.15140) TaxID=1229662 RepID=W3X9C3_PESFW|nr:uncharacterized protein PFICI_04515 [Pestalotiopsis fici W106-1]ETS82639.1 hypothetical protein PFICI_04515 [Pestalotiopsis fici W106-1]